MKIEKSKPRKSAAELVSGEGRAGYGREVRVGFVLVCCVCLSYI